jgi:hypothetical protein
MNTDEPVEKERFSMFAMQERFIAGIIEKGKTYTLNDVQDKVDAFCRKHGLPRVSDRFCTLKITKYGGRFGSRGGPRNMISTRPKKVKKARRVFAFCPDPDLIV